MTEVIVEQSRLGTLGTLLATGGQARIYLLPRLMTLPDAPGVLVYKQYKNGHAPPHGLRRVVAVRTDLDPPGRAKLDSMTAWPLRVVESGRRVTGVVMSLIDDSFFQQRTLPSGAKHRGGREIQNLFIDPTRARVVGMPFPTLDQRYVLCRDLAAALHLVHRHELVFGDFNARNALFRLDARPSVVLVDCDAVRIKGTMAVVAQLNAVDWDPPEGTNALTQETDRYKLGLFMLRCLAPGPQASVSRDPARADGVLDGEGRRLLRDALADRPRDRPTARDWGYYWEWRISGRRLGPPRQTVPPDPADPPHVAPQGWRRDASGVWQPVTTGPGATTGGTSGVPSNPARSTTKGWRRAADDTWQQTD